MQVTTSSVVIVADDQQLQFIPLQLTFPAISASIVDPFIAICTQNGKLLLYELVNHPHIHLKVYLRSYVVHRFLFTFIIIKELLRIITIAIFFIIYFFTS